MKEVFLSPDLAPVHEVAAANLGRSAAVHAHFFQVECRRGDRGGKEATLLLAADSGAHRDRWEGELGETHRRLCAEEGLTIETKGEYSVDF